MSETPECLWLTYMEFQNGDLIRHDDVFEKINAAKYRQEVAIRGYFLQDERRASDFRDDLYRLMNEKQDLTFILLLFPDEVQNVRPCFTGDSWDSDGVWNGIKFTNIALAKLLPRELQGKLGTDEALGDSVLLDAHDSSFDKLASRFAVIMQQIGSGGFVCVGPQ